MLEGAYVQILDNKKVGEPYSEYGGKKTKVLLFLLNIYKRKTEEQ